MEALDVFNPSALGVSDELSEFFCTSHGKYTKGLGKEDILLPSALAEPNVWLCGIDAWLINLSKLLHYRIICLF